MSLTRKPLQTRRVGWYGKLPTLGDFASRRLDPAFIEPWDHWLASGLAAWRAADPQWLQAYLAGPTWRFLLAPGAIAKGSPAVAGVLMPSVDQVGRYFPLTLVQGWPLHGPWPGSELALQALLVWLHRLDDLAVDAMQEDWSVASFEAALDQLGLPEAPIPAQAEHGEPCLPRWAQPLLQAGLAAPCSSWWWCLDAQAEPCLFTGTGLPRQEGFALLMSGRLHEFGVTPPFRALCPRPLTLSGDPHE